MALLIPAALLLAAAQARPQVAVVDSFVNAEMQRQRIPGVAIAVIRSGHPWLAKGYGYANLEHMVPVSDVTIFQSRFTDGTAAILNPGLAIRPLAPIADREPEVVKTLYRVLDRTREGKLTPRVSPVCVPASSPERPARTRRSFSASGLRRRQC